MNGNERYILEGIIIVLAAAYIFYENVLMSFILSPYVYIHYRQRIKERIVHDKKNFKKKFKDGIIAVSFALNVGYSIENAFGQAVDELTLMYGGDSDIVVKFKHIVIRLGQNENLEDILDDFAEESKVEDIMYFAEIFRYAKRSGGDLMAVIKNTAQIIQQKEEVMSEVDTIISGKKMEQRVMSLIPAAIVIYLKVTAKEFIQPLYGNIAGIIIMTVCLGVYVISDMWAKRIVNKLNNDPEAVLKATADELTDIDGIGEVIAEAFVEYFKNEDKKDEYLDILSEVNIKEAENAQTTEELAGKTFVITGNVNHFANRNELKALIESMGGKVTGSVTGNTSYLINNDSTSQSTKNKKAAQLGVPVITEEEFIKLAGKDELL